MRLRKIKNAEELINQHPLVITDANKHKGKWNRYFGNEYPLHIEIGMGKGDFIYQMAINNPKINFIGIEKYPSVLLRATQKIPVTLNNLVLLNVDANLLENIFDREVDIIYLNHSDPWPKERHAKRRLTSPWFLNIYQKIGKQQMLLKVQTDNKDLFEYSKQSLTENGFAFNKELCELKPESLIMTEYERRFRELGQDIYQLEAKIMHGK